MQVVRQVVLILEGHGNCFGANSKLRQYKRTDPAHLKLTELIIESVIFHPLSLSLSDFPPQFSNFYPSLSNPSLILSQIGENFLIRSSI